MTEDEIIEELNLLNEKRKECEVNLIYREAEMIREKIDEMKAALDKKKMYAIHDNHMQERKKVDGDKSKKIDNLNRYWEEKLKEFEEKSSSLMKRLQEKHAEEYNSYEKEVRAEIPEKSSSPIYPEKKSAALLNAEKIMKGLAGKQKYKEAEKVYEQIKVKVDETGAG